MGAALGRHFEMELAGFYFKNADLGGGEVVPRNSVYLIFPSCIDIGMCGNNGQRNSHSDQSKCN